MAFLMFAAASRVARAQDVRSDSAVCDSLPQFGLRTDTIAAQVSIEPANALPAGWEEMLLAGISEHFTMPATVGSSVYGASKIVDGRPLVSVVVSGEVTADIDRNGVLRDPRISVSTLSPEIDRRLVAAVRGLDSTRALPQFPEETKIDSVRVRYRISEYPDSGKVMRPLSVVRQPTWILERPAFAKRGGPWPRYPREAERARLGDEVLVSFVVGGDGKALMQTVRVLRGHYREFQLSVLEVLPRIRFDPARIAGCQVQQLVQMPFSFRIPD
jgi:TonB family protein